MNEWARLVDRYSAELKKYEMICAFCGQHLADSNINEDCMSNVRERDPMDGGVYLTEEQPNRNVFGKRKHWFGQPSTKGFKHTALNDLRNQNNYPTIGLAAGNVTTEAFL